MRYLAKCDGPLRELNQLRAPMASVLDFFVQQKKELDRYRETYGELPSADGGTKETDDAETDSSQAGPADDPDDGNEEDCDDSEGEDDSECDSDESDTS